VSAIARKRGGGPKPIYEVAARERILAEARRVPDPEQRRHRYLVIDDLAPRVASSARMLAEDQYLHDFAPSAGSRILVGT